MSPCLGGSPKILGGFGGLFFLPDRISEVAEALAERIVVPVGIGEESGLFQGKSPVCRHQVFRRLYCHDFCEEHCVAAEFERLREFAFDVYGAFGDDGGLDEERGGRGEARAGELVHVSAGGDAAVVGGPGERDGRDVDDEFAGFFYDGVGVAVGADGD